MTSDFWTTLIYDYRWHWFTQHTVTRWDLTYIYTTGETWQRKHWTVLPVYITAAENIADAVSFIRRIVLWSQNKFSPNLAAVRFEFRNPARSISGRFEIVISGTTLTENSNIKITELSKRHNNVVFWVVASSWNDLEELLKVIGSKTVR